MVKIYKTLVCILLVSSCLLFSGCFERASDGVKEDAKVIYTTNYPLAYFAERIVGDAYEVVFPEIDGDPAFWKPGPAQIADFQTANWILINGADYEKWLHAVSLPVSKTVNTSRGFKDRYIHVDGTGMHSHGNGEMHSHGAIAFTTWIDMRLAIQQASVIDEKLELTDTGYVDLKRDLLDLDARIKDAFTPFRGKFIIGSHPVYQYLARRYGLSMESVHWEPDVIPGAEQLKELDDLLSNRESKIMLWEGEPLAETKALLSGRGIECVVFDPCGNRPAEGDFMTVMESNIANLIQFSAQ
ncbi:MAG: metal ABC transporter substrate-binding protein [Opitutales bacterium]